QQLQNDASNRAPLAATFSRAAMASVQPSEESDKESNSPPLGNGPVSPRWSETREGKEVLNRLTRLDDKVTELNDLVGTLFILFSVLMRYHMPLSHILAF